MLQLSPPFLQTQRSSRRGCIFRSPLASFQSIKQSEQLLVRAQYTSTHCFPFDNEIGVLSTFMERGRVIFLLAMDIDLSDEITLR